MTIVFSCSVVKRIVNMIMPLSLFGLKFLEWWYSSEHSDVVRRVTSLPVPPPPGRVKVSTCCMPVVSVTVRLSAYPLIHACTECTNALVHSTFHLTTQSWPHFFLIATSTRYTVTYRSNSMSSLPEHKKEPHSHCLFRVSDCETVVSWDILHVFLGVCSAMLVSMVTFGHMGSVQSHWFPPRTLN